MTSVPNTHDQAGSERAAASLAEVAATFSVTVKTVRRWVSEGRLHPLRTTSGLWFRRSEIQELVADEGGEASPEPPLKGQSRRSGH